MCKIGKRTTRQKATAGPETQQIVVNAPIVQAVLCSNRYNLT